MQDFPPNSSIFIRILTILSIMVCVIFSFSVLLAGDYSRDKFKHWSDLDGDGLDTREELLVSQAVSPGVWVCPYTGLVINDPKKLAADHIVSLKTAWECGAKDWTDEQREQFANDEENLILVLSSANSSKSDKTPSEWLPLNMAYWPKFVDNTDYICAKYKLSCPASDPRGMVEKVRNLKGLQQ